MVSKGMDLEGLTDTRECWLDDPAPAGVQFVCGEDHPTKVVRPRLRLQGAALGRIQIAAHPEGRPITTLHLDGFRQQWDSSGPPALLVLDPASTMIPAGVDGNAQADVKASVTGPLGKLAQDYGTCVLLVAHVGKGALSGGAHPSTWVLGSTEWVAGPRSSLVALGHQHDMEDEVVRVFHAKANLGPRGPAFAYEVVSAGRHCKVEWRGLTDDTPASLTAKPQQDRSSPAAVEWLQSALAEGPVRTTEVKFLASREGISENALRQARYKLGVSGVRVSGSHWSWGLPSSD